MKRAMLLVTSALLAVGLLVAAPAPTHAKVKLAGWLKPSTTSVERHGQVTFRGFLPPRARRTVFLKSRVSWGWSAVGKSVTNRRGRFSFTYTAPGTPGKVVLRVVAPRRRINGRTYTRVRTPRRVLMIEPGPQAAQGDLTRITDGSDVSERPAVSADGRYVVFDSKAPNLVPGDTNEYRDVFVHDRQTGVTTAVTNGHGSSYAGAISADGRYIVFDSYASSLDPNDTNRARDVYIYDQLTDTAKRITDGNDNSCASTNASRSCGSGISADGRFVVFVSSASDLVPDDTNGYSDVFLYDRDTETTTAVTGGTAGAQVPAISADGRWISFSSSASNLVPLDRNRARDVFLFDREGDTLSRITNGNAGSYSSSSALTADGRYVTYYSSATDLVAGDTNQRDDVFVYDRVDDTTTLLTQGNNHSQVPTFSADGQHLAFESYSSDLAPGDHNDLVDVFVYDWESGATTRLSKGAGPSYGAMMSGDGGVIAFTSEAGNLVPNDTNNLADVFTWVRELPPPS